jgi:electron transport complex protein RnfC
MFKFSSKIASFQGGVYLIDHKKSTAHKPSVKAPIPKRIWLPLIQNTGLPCRIIVSVGDKVKVGTKIGEAEGNISAHIHSSISGKVIEITEMNHPILPTRFLTCVIESDGQDIWEDKIKEQDCTNFSIEDLIDLIKNAGIVGLGGGAFPTHIKITPAKEKPIDTLIINGCECEPYLTADHRLMLEKASEIIEGTKILAKILQVKNIVFAIEKNKQNAFEQISNLLHINPNFNFENCKVKIVNLSTKYPQGSEKHLIKALLNRVIPAKGLPLDVGVVVQNVGTAHAVYEACRYNKPLVEKLITVTGTGINQPQNLWVRLGTPVNDIINFCGGYTSEPAKIIFGGPMMGIAQYTDEMPITKGTSGILIFTNQKAKIKDEGPCIRCGRCVNSCPMLLLPYELNNFIKKRYFAKAQENNILECIECGCCSYVCPSKIKLVHAFKFAKNEITLLNK